LNKFAISECNIVARLFFSTLIVILGALVGHVLILKRCNLFKDWNLVGSGGSGNFSGGGGQKGCNNKRFHLYQINLG